MQRVGMKGKAEGSIPWTHPTVWLVLLSDQPEVGNMIVGFGVA